MAFDSTFRTPIPGSSLTHKMGDLPHERPPKFTDPNEALEYFWKQLHQPDVLKQIWQIARQGGTVWAIRRAILFKACLEGIIQFNLAVVIGQTIDQMLQAIIKARGISPTLNPKFKNKNKEAAIHAKLQQMVMQQDKLGVINKKPPIATDEPPIDNITDLSQPQQQDQGNTQSPQPQQGPGLLGQGT